MEIWKSNFLFPSFNGAQNSKNIITTLPYFPNTRSQLLHKHHSCYLFQSLSLNLTLSYPHLCIFSSKSIPQISKMYQPSISTPNNHTKEQSNPKTVGIEIDLSDVITDVVPLSMVLGHATPIRKVGSCASRKGKPSVRP